MRTLFQKSFEECVLSPALRVSLGKGLGTYEIRKRPQGSPEDVKCNFACLRIGTGQLGGFAENPSGLDPFRQFLYEHHGKDRIDGKQEKISQAFPDAVPLHVRKQPCLCEPFDECVIQINRIGELSEAAHSFVI